MICMFIHVGEGEESKEQGGGGGDLERAMAEMATKVNCIHIRIYVLICFYIMRMCMCMHVRMAARGGVLQCVAVCCSVLQCVAVCCSVLQCVAVCRGTCETRCGKGT